MGFLAALAVRPVAAHGGEGILQLNGAQAGSYTLRVWTSPGVLQVGPLHVETAVFDAQGRPAPNNVVWIRLVPLDPAGPTQSMLAGPVDAAHGFLREATLTVEQSGRYQVAVTVVGEEGSGGTATFELQVSPLSVVAKLLIYLQIGVGILSGIWLLKEGMIVWSIGAPEKGTARST